MHKDDTKAPSTGKARDPDAEGDSRAPADEKKPKRIYGLRLWQVGLVVVSVVLMGLGIFLGMNDTSDGAAASNGEVPGAVVRGFGEGGEPVLGPDGEPIETTDGTGDALSPAIFRMGFSFFVGFAIAFALRTVARFALVFAGLFLLLLFGLQYAGIVDVQWAVLGDRYSETTGWLQSQFSSLKAFLTGYLPSGAAGMAGLYTGFRRR